MTGVNTPFVAAPGQAIIWQCVNWVGRDALQVVVPGGHPDIGCRGMSRPRD
jgi:hypothetical protein